MRAIVSTGYGSPDVLELREIEKPTPKDDEILIRVRATTVTTADWRARSLAMPPGFGPMGRLIFGISGPRQPILGTELAGEVESVGKDVTRFSPGDAVFAFRGAGMGCHVEYRTMPESGAVAHKPPNLSFEEAAALSFGGTTALSFFRRAKIQPGERVLINGASGGVGTAAVQLAKHFGAHVTGVCSTDNVELVTSLGADRVIDYTREDFAADGATYDIIMDTVGTIPYARARASLTKDGRLLTVLGGLQELLRSPWISLSTSHRVIAGPAGGNAEDLRFLAARAEAGEFTPVIDRRYPFEEMPDAHRYVDLGHKKGNVAVLL
ncbi:MAG: NAD(P)-dependent alcohol dehydrogenase [Gemmatimonadota bacterium]